MSRQKTESNRTGVYVLLAAVVVCIGSSIVMMPYVPDDSYISFRYAENWASGHGLTFNPGEAPVEAYSNFLWIVLCAAVFKMGFSLPTAMPVVGVLIAMANVALLWTILRRRGVPPLQALFPLVLLACSGPFIMYAISGMEMPLFALLLLSMMYCLDVALVGGRLLAYGLLAANGVLLALCRPEGIIGLPVALIATYLFGRRRDRTAPSMKQLAIASGVFVGVMVAYHAIRISYFGEVLPTPFLSKAGGGQSLWFGWGQNLQIYFSHQGDYFPPLGYYFAALTVMAILGLRLHNAPNARIIEQVAFALAITYTVVYFNFKDWMPGMRYNSAIVGLLLIPAAHVQNRFFAAGNPTAGAHGDRRQRANEFWLIGIAVVLMSYAMLAELRITTQRTEDANQKCLVALGKWLRDVLPPTSVLAMSDVGAVPYYSGFITVDFHPESLADLYIAKNGFSKDYVFGREPDVIVFPSRGIHTAKFYPEHYGMAQDPRFQQIYRFVGTSRYDWRQDRCYWVFVSRKHRPPTEEQMEAFPVGIGTFARKFKPGRDN